MDYDDRHRTFLQAVIQSGVILDQDAVVLCVKIFDEKIDISAIAARINDKLERLAMSMKAGICELTGNKYWSVVSTTHEETVKIPTELTQSQKMFLRSIYSEIIGGDGCISSTSCLNLCNSLETKFSMIEADRFLKHLIKQKWLYCKDGNIYMGVRSIIELMPYFRATYQDNFHNCFLCREVVFHGHKCDNCDEMCHYYCLIEYAKNRNIRKCPQCKHNLDISCITGNRYYYILHQ
ncbi:PREDICTED: non-structural maintenance of chromosomes element 1 homolog [Ceratosolen solmsi marchali]|uniref:Non-structural maintenance of chromosomes element 1 homolog n=1 Tax=Ceratosolen solmsi marchali TaxID=326594 RepID=A0AAJ6YHP3_9HYME|nr:PREDICTED: non-structural maintenance of chromosomes element 1 homolog [Ceratosolen solmsi marchali]